MMMNRQYLICTNTRITEGEFEIPAEINAEYFKKLHAQPRRAADIFDDDAKEKVIILCCFVLAF